MSHDLVQGGRSEVIARARNAAIERWMVDGDIAAVLGSVEGLNLAEIVARTRIEVRLDVGTPSVEALAGAAETIRAVAQASRPLEPSDLNAAAAPGQRLTEAREIELTAFATRALADRARALLAILTELVPRLADSRRASGLDRQAGEGLSDPQAAASVATLNSDRKAADRSDAR